MRALVKFRRGDGFTELREVLKPKVESHYALVKVKAVGICGADIHFYRGRYDELLRPPVILGHEFSGVVVEVGSEVKGFAIGDRVTCETHGEVCGECYHCISGNYNLCPQRRGFGYQKDGAFAEYILVPSIRLHKLPDVISFEEGALTEPTSVVHHALAEKGQIKPGDIIVVTGPGPIGILSAQMARIQGAQKVIVTGLTADESRLELALKLGADVTINVEKEDAVEEVVKITGGLGCDVLVEASGEAQPKRDALEMVRKGGQILLVGHGSGKMEIDLDQVTRKEISLIGTWSHTWKNWERSLKLIAAKRIDVGALITHRFPLADWKNAFKVVEDRKALKAIIIP